VLSQLGDLHLKGKEKEVSCKVKLLLMFQPILQPIAVQTSFQGVASGDGGNGEGESSGSGPSANFTQATATELEAAAGPTFSVIQDLQGKEHEGFSVGIL